MITFNRIWWWWPYKRGGWRALSLTLSLHGLVFSGGVRLIWFGFDWAIGWWERLPHIDETTFAEFKEDE